MENLRTILETTLESFLDLVQCDAGSVYTVRKGAAATDILKFEAMITRSINLRGVPDHLRTLEFAIDDSSIVGKTAADKKPILLDPLADTGQASQRVGELLNYPTTNIFSGPLITPRGDLVGVVQLLNKIPRFDEKDKRLFS